MTQTAEPPNVSTTKRQTTYHVLEQTNAQGAAPTFRLVSRDVKAASAEAAVRAHAEKAAAQAENKDEIDVTKMAPGTGTFIAVPSRSWKPVTVKAETKTVLHLS